MTFFEEKLKVFIQEIKDFFHTNFISLFIFDFDGLPVECSKGHLYREEEVGPLTVSLLLSIDRIIDLISNEVHHTIILTTSEQNIILSQIEDLNLIMLLVLKNEKDSLLLKYGENTSQQIKKLMMNITITDSVQIEEDSVHLEPLLKLPSTSRESIETLQIKQAINLLNNIMAKGAYKTNMAAKMFIKTETITHNTVSNSLNLLIIALNRLNNNFDITWRPKLPRKPINSIERRIRDFIENP
ncbi:MAG: hypothetical protein ACFFCV_11660 [Promethearchaeota archaeon]